MELFENCPRKNVPDRNEPNVDHAADDQKVFASGGMSFGNMAL